MGCHAWLSHALEWEDNCTEGQILVKNDLMKHKMYHVISALIFENIFIRFLYLMTHLFTPLGRLIKGNKTCNLQVVSHAQSLQNSVKKPVFGIFHQVSIKLAWSDTQTSESHKFADKETRDIILSRQRTKKGADQTVQMQRLICAFVVGIYQQQVFSWCGSILFADNYTDLTLG